MKSGDEEKYQYIANNFEYLPYDKKKRLAKFLYTYDDGLISPYNDGCIARITAFNNIVLEHVYNFVKANVWINH